MRGGTLAHLIPLPASIAALAQGRLWSVATVGARRSAL
jgi:hypothetical protein